MGGFAGTALGAALVLFLLGGAALAAGTQGEQLYEQYCAGCHGSAGEGRGTYPALADNPGAADTPAVDEVIRKGARGMPGFSQLAEGEIEAITAHVVSLAGGAEPAGSDGDPGQGPAQAPGAEPLPPGEADRGEDYFLGKTRLAEGGAACAACHQAGGAGGIGGGSLGSDLTGLADRMGGAEGVAAALENPAFAVMRASYQDRPLSAQERADLAAFFVEVAGGARADKDSSLLPPFWLFGVAGTVGLFVVMGVFWSRRGLSPAQRIRGKG
jgi:ubiquinol-cytochrome c reductase cytochrome c subunit